MNNWQESQIQALIAAGVDAVDAQAVVSIVAEVMPEEADPETYFLHVASLFENVRDFVADARVMWYASEDVPVWAKRLLDAQEVA